MTATLWGPEASDLARKLNPADLQSIEVKLRNITRFLCGLPLSDSDLSLEEAAHLDYLAGKAIESPGEKIFFHFDVVSSNDVTLIMHLAISDTLIGDHAVELHRFHWRMKLPVVVESSAAADLTIRPTRPARRATGLAVRLAGPQRSHLRGEWTAVLAGSPEEGVTFSAGRQLLLALGFLVAALRMRSHDAARPLWRPVDWTLQTQARTNGFITTVVGAQATYIVGDDGPAALVTEVWEPCGIAGAALFVLTRWLRRVRGIELATPEREPADE